MVLCVVMPLRHSACFPCLYYPLFRAENNHGGPSLGASLDVLGESTSAIVTHTHTHTHTFSVATWECERWFPSSPMIGYEKHSLLWYSGRVSRAKFSCAAQMSFNQILQSLRPLTNGYLLRPNHINVLLMDFFLATLTWSISHL